MDSDSLFVHISLLGSFVYYYKGTFVPHDSFERYSKQASQRLPANVTTAFAGTCQSMTQSVHSHSSTPT